jgi:hypothetical protein
MSMTGTVTHSVPLKGEIDIAKIVFVVVTPFCEPAILETCP